MWDQVKAFGNEEPVYFGPLSDENTEELEQRALGQDKKTTKGFEWTSGKGSTSVSKSTNMDIQESPKDCAIEIPSWDDFTNATTFHGVKYIFSKSSGKVRR